MNILIVTPWQDDLILDEVKGMPLNAFFIKKLKEKKHNVEIFFTTDKILPIPFNVIAYFFNNFAAYHKINKKNKSWLSKIDIILGLTGNSSLALKVLAKKLKIPCVIELFGTFELSKNPYSTIKIIQYFDDIITCIIKPDAIFAVNDGSSPKKCIKAWGGAHKKIIEFTNPRPIIEAKIENHSTTSMCIGYFTRFNKLKGIDYFIKIAEKIINKYPYVRFIIAGGGPLEKKIINFAKLYNKNVEYCGFLRYKEMPNLYKKIDILISTNIYGNGTLPVIEAQYFGIPVVAFDILDTKKFIIDNKTGFLVPPFNVDTFFNKLSILIENKELIKNMGYYGHNFAKNFPDYNELMNYLVHKLENIIG